MQILINSDNKSNVDERFINHSSDLVNDHLRRWENQITRIEVHFTDESSNKEGKKDKRCLVEARLEGIPPIAATSHAATHDNALKGALEKLGASLNTRIGRLRTSTRQPDKSISFWDKEQNTEG